MFIHIFNKLTRVINIKTTAKMHSEKMKLIQTKCTINHKNKIEHEENAISEFEYKSKEKKRFLYKYTLQIL